MQPENKTANYDIETKSDFEVNLREASQRIWKLASCMRPEFTNLVNSLNLNTACQA